MMSRFSKVINSFKNLGSGLSRLDERLDKIDGHLDKIDGHLDKVDGRLDKIDGHLDKVDGRLDKIDKDQQPDNSFDIQGSKFGEVFEISPEKILKQSGFRGPLMHVGSKVNAEDSIAKTSAENLRKFYSKILVDNQDFYGVDIFDGYNVDIVADLCDENLFLSNELSKYKGFFKTVICWALLEHVENPFIAAKNISNFLSDGGRIYYIGPWVWGYHPYPDDYWRISFPALKVLFPEIDWQDWWYSGTEANVGYRIKKLRNERKVFQVQMGLIQKLSGISDRALPYTNLNALGVKRIE